MSKKRRLTVVNPHSAVGYDPHFSSKEAHQEYLALEKELKKAPIDLPSFSLGAFFAFLGFLIFGK